MRKSAMTVAFVVLLAAGSAVAQSRGGDRPPPPPPGPPPLEMVIVDHAEDLGLTAAQIEQVQALAEAARSEMGALHQQVGAAFEGGTKAEFLAAMRALRERQDALMEAVLAVLTDAQWSALCDLLPPPPPPPPPPPQR